MKDKTQYEALMEELQKIVENFRVGVTEIGERFAKLLPDIEISEEDTWEMKCPYRYNDEYFYINTCGNVLGDRWCNFYGEEEAVALGNTFPTREAAELEVKRRNLLTRFRAFRDECNNGWKPDFSDDEEKYYLYYSTLEECIDVGWIIIGCSFNIFGYFKKSKDAQRAIKLFGDEIQKLFIDCECD